MQALKVMEQAVQDAPDRQVSLSDPDARSMATSGKGTATVGYNVQIAVDAEHHLIVAHEVINQGYDRHQLAPMALKAQQATGSAQITALADRGYFNGDQVLSCEGTGVAPIVPKALSSCLPRSKPSISGSVTVSRMQAISKSLKRFGRLYLSW
jgi:hypothetical protein